MRRLSHALDIAQKAVERLATRGYTDPLVPANAVRPEKVIAETAILLLAASTVDRHNGIRERVRHVAQLLVPHARSDRMLIGICLEPAVALDYAQAHICLSRLGYADAEFDALLSQSLKSQAKTGRERLPYRALEQEWLTNAWESYDSTASRRKRPIKHHSVLAHPMDLFSGTKDDVYAFTHTLMYVTDFNIRPMSLLRRRSEILAEAEVALAACLDDQDYDLGGEVLLAWPLTGGLWSSAATFGFRVLARVEDQAGFLPSSSTRLDRLQGLHGDDRAEYLLATAYHTAYVMGLLCAAALQPGRAPPSRIPISSAVPGSSKAILQFLNGDAPFHWRDELRHLTERERDALSGCLFNIALRRNIKQRAFGVVAKLLAVGDTLQLCNTPAASQAAEMLQRLAMFATIKRARPTEIAPLCQPGA